MLNFVNLYIINVLILYFVEKNTKFCHFFTFTLYNNHFVI